MLTDLTNVTALERALRRLDEQRSIDAARAAFVNDPRSLLIVSIPKSGTTWVRYLLANYAAQRTQPGAARIGYEDLDQYTADREKIRNGTAPVPTTITAFSPDDGIDHMLYEHPFRRRLYWDIQEHGGPKLCLTRNLLDFLVSCYFFYFEYRDVSRHKAAHPRDLIPAYTYFWAVCWRFITERLVAGGRAAIVAYEALRADTAAVIGTALRDLGITVDEDSLARAVPLADVTNTRTDESRLSEPLVGRIDRGSFARDGSVGQWREHFAPADIDAVRKLLGDLGIPIDAALPVEVC